MEKFEFTVKYTCSPDKIADGFSNTYEAVISCEWKDGAISLVEKEHWNFQYLQMSVAEYINSLKAVRDNQSYIERHGGI